MCGQSESDSDIGEAIYFGRQEEPKDLAEQQQHDFLQNFQLFSSKEVKSEPSIKMIANKNNNNSSRLNNNNCARQLDMPLTPDKRRRHQPRTQIMKDKCPAIPFASPAGQRVIKLTKVSLAENYERERIERYERFCVAPPLAPDDSNRPKFMDRKLHRPTFFTSSSFRSNSHLRPFKYPRRQFSTRLRDADVTTFQQILLRQNKCVPLTVCTPRMSKEEIEILQSDVKRRKLSKPPANIVDIIDLCSSDSDGEAYDEIDGSSTSGVTASSSLQSSSSLVQSTGNYPLFVDCSIVNETITTVTNIETIQTDAIFQSLITNSESIGYGRDELQQNKENHLMQFIADQANAQAVRLASVNSMTLDLTL